MISIQIRTRANGYKLFFPSWLNFIKGEWTSMFKKVLFCSLEVRTQKYLCTLKKNAKERGATDQRQKEQLMEQGPGRDGNE